MNCPECGKEFSRKDNLKRHINSKHKFQKSPKTEIASPCTSFQLLHPFTAIVAGMTGSGKTVWVQSLLQQAAQTIHPPPQRIVWSYSQWQPAYDQMQKTIPGVEFVKGIPHDLDEDWFFDSKMNNLIVIDDQMTETSNDKRILNLFTKGSHHRNLSVVFLLQNLYFQGKIMRTLSLNAAYLVLFKNPRDKLQMMTLGKQMYPGKTEQFIQKYEAAVERPYGYLFVDLKPNTPDGCRLRTNVLPSDQSSAQTPPTAPRSTGETEAMKSMANYFERQGYLQSPLLQSMQSLEGQMNHILKDPNVPEEIKIKEYNQLFNRYLNLQQQVQLNHVVTRPRQEAVQTIPSVPPDRLPTSNLATPENIPSTSLSRDSGFASSKTPSFLERLTSKIRTPSTSRPPTSVEVPCTPLKAPSRSEVGQPTTLFSTPTTQSIPPLPEFLLTPPPSKDQPLKWINYQDSEKYKDVIMKPPRRSERLRAMIKSLPKWEKY